MPNRDKFNRRGQSCESETLDPYNKRSPTPSSGAKLSHDPFRGLSGLQNADLSDQMAARSEENGDLSDQFDQTRLLLQRTDQRLVECGQGHFLLPGQGDQVSVGDLIGTTHQIGADDAVLAT